MPTWKIRRGADALFEGTVLFATIAGATLSPIDLAGATLTWHMGSVWGTSMMTRDSATGTNFAFGTSIGTFTFEISDVDTENFAATNYWYDLWMTTSGGKEYVVEVGTLKILTVVGTL